MLFTLGEVGTEKTLPSVSTVLGSLRNAVFREGDGDWMSYLLPDDVVRILDPSSGFGADVKIEILPLSLER